MVGLNTALAAEREPAPADQAEGTASPEEQADYERLVTNAMKVVYGDGEVNPQILDTLQAGDDPIAALGEATATVVMSLIRSARKAGKELSADVLFHAGTEIFEDLANLATEAGIHDFNNDPDALEGAFFIALDRVRLMQEQDGSLDKPAAESDLQALQQEDQSGALRDRLMAMEGDDSAPQEDPDAAAEDEPADEEEAPEDEDEAPKEEEEQPSPPGLGVSSQNRPNQKPMR
ncbi:MAG: hypothetical protein ACK50Q_01150 [Labrys sp. (in: a-proteobacteria)]